MIVRSVIPVLSPLKISVMTQEVFCFVFRRNCSLDERWVSRDPPRPCCSQPQATNSALRKVLRVL